MPDHANVLDRIIATVAPGVAAGRVANRRAFREMAGLGSYEAVRNTPYRTVNANYWAMSGAEESALGAGDRSRLIQECQDLYRNNEIAHGAVNRYSDYSVWMGITPEPDTSSEPWNDAAKAFWVQEYTPAADFRRRPGVDLVKIQKQIVNADCLHGESFFILLKNGQIQPIEAERVRTPDTMRTDDRVIDGVRTARSGIITGYYVCPRNGIGGVDGSKFEFVKRENMIHVADPWRVDQLRGVPKLGCAVAKLRDYDETDLYTLNKVKIEGMQTLRSKRDRGGSLNDLSRTYTNEDDSGNKTTVEKHQWGQIWRLAQGEDVDAIEMRSPNSQHVAYMEHQLRSIAAALSLPYEYLMLIFTSGSFSAQRAAMLHAQHTFRQVHAMVTRCFLQRLWNWRIAKAIKAGRLDPAPVNDRGVSEWFKVQWSLPWFGWVDPKSETAANKERWALGNTSLAEIARTEGKDRDRILDEKSADIQAALARAEAINNAHAEAGVTWRDFINAGTPGVSTAATEPPPPPPDPDDSGDDDTDQDEDGNP